MFHVEQGMAMNRRELLTGAAAVAVSAVMPEAAVEMIDLTFVVAQPTHHLGFPIVMGPLPVPYPYGSSPGMIGGLPSQAELRAMALRMLAFYKDPPPIELGWRGAD